MIEKFCGSRWWFWLGCITYTGLFNHEVLTVILDNIISTNYRCQWTIRILPQLIKFVPIRTFTKWFSAVNKPNKI